MRSTRARQLRAQSSDPERVLWGHLRGRRLDGLKFRRQTPLGSYIVDFYCHATGVVVEVDGAQHADQVEEDQERTTWLTNRGFRVLRFGTAAILSGLDAVLDTILVVCRERAGEGRIGED